MSAWEIAGHKLTTHTFAGFSIIESDEREKEIMRVKQVKSCCCFDPKQFPFMNLFNVHFVHPDWIDAEMRMLIS